MYDDEVCRVYRVENGFVVECREEKPPVKGKDNSPCCGPMYDTKTFTAPTAGAALAIVKEKLSAPPDEYADGFKEATAKK